MKFDKYIIKKFSHNREIKANKIEIIGERTLKVEIISDKYGVKYFYADENSYDILKYFTWFLSAGSTHLYVVTDVNVDGKTYRLYLHNILTSCPKLLFVDHIDGDTFNNKLENLRIATRKQNARNCRKPTHYKSGYKNICWDNSKQMWRIFINVNNKQVFNNYRKTLDEAIRLRDLKLKELHEDFSSNGERSHA